MSYDALDCSAALGHALLVAGAQSRLVRQLQFEERSIVGFLEVEMGKDRASSW